MELTRIFEDRPEEPELQRLARSRRDIIATRDQWRSIQSPVDAADRGSAEQASTEAGAALEAWRSSTGSVLEGVFAAFQNSFPILPRHWQWDRSGRARRHFKRLTRS